MIEFTNVSKSYKDKLILRDINMTFSSGEFVAIIGSSGCGKTTLLKMINKLLPMDRGDIIIDGKSIRRDPRYQNKKRNRVCGTGRRTVSTFYSKRES